jgi:AbrB family looped-hinge helix DNA binding protein
MTVTIDKFGRILIPKKVREELHLSPDDAVELRVEDGVIHIRPIPQEAPLRFEGRVLVVDAEAVGDLENALERSRDERLDAAASW